MEIEIYSNTEDSIKKCCLDNEFPEDCFEDLLDSDSVFFFLIKDGSLLSDQCVNIPEELDKDSYEPLEGLVVYQGILSISEIQNAWEKNGFECSFVC
jgi:hypothetical protein